MMSKREVKKPRKRRVKRRREYPVVGPLKLQRLGKAYYLPVPMRWFRVHRLDPKRVRELLVVADKNILIVHPGEVRRITRSLSKLIRSP